MDLKIIGGIHLVNVNVGNPSVSVIRAEDFLILNFEFVNLSVAQAGQGQTLNVVDANKPAYIIVHFPPQNIAEQAFFEAANQPGQQFQTSPPDVPGSENPSPPPIEARLAGPSRLVFKVPPKSAPIPLTLQDLLLRCTQYDLNIASAAHGPTFIDISQFPHLGAVQPTKPSPPLHNLILQNRALLLAKTSPTVQKTAPVTASAIKETMHVAAAPAPAITVPSGLETAIEMPYRLNISQNQYGAWAHASAPVRSSETRRTELWHTRSAIRKATGAGLEENSPLDVLRRCSAIWTRDWPGPTPPPSPPPHQNVPFRTSLDASDRHNIVLLSANNNCLDVNRLMLSSLGGWLDVHASWNPAPPLTVQEWRHIAAMGRDHYARVVYKGYLFPFGHGASLVKVTERKFHMSLPDPLFTTRPGNPAYLRQRMYIVVREPEKTFLSRAVNPENQQRYDLQMPFQRVRITTMVTPDLDSPANQSQFYPMVGGSDFLFHMVAEGLDGKEIDFSAPLLFLDTSPQGDLSDRATLQRLAADYEQKKGTYNLSGQNVVFADSTDANAADGVKPGSTKLEAASITFGAEIPRDGATLQALYTSCHFYPALRGAQVAVPAIKHLAGNDAPVGVKYHPAYLQHGFDSGNPQNAGQVFLEMVSGTDINFTAAGHGDRTGALISPNMRMMGLSRLLGPVAGTLDKVAAGSFDPIDFFKNAAPLLFGTIPLTGILKALNFSDLNKLPRFMTEAVTVVEELLQDITAVQTLIGSLSGLQAQARMPAAVKPALTSPMDMVTPVANDITQIIKDLEQLVTNPLNPPQTLVADLQKLAGDQQNPGDLQKLVDSLPSIGPVADAKRSLQQICTRLNQELADKTFLDALIAVENLTVKFEWKPDIQPWGFSGDFLNKPLDNALFWPTNANSCTISVELHVQRGTGEPGADIYCGLRDFRLQLIAPEKFLTLHFDVVEFTAASGKKPDVNVKLNQTDGVQFVGPLSFVETLRQLIPLDGFSDPPALSITADGIDASYSIGLPTVGVGVFTLQNLSLGAGFNVPFIGKPLSVRFNFCTRDQPFLLTVAMFGGGGFFGLVIDPHGVQKLEAALEFGASVVLNFGVASGGVSVMAGIYFSMLAGQGGQPDTVNLDGFLRIDGQVEVLGIVTISITIDLELQYVSPSSVAGDATITVEVSVLFFSATVPIHCHKQFAGGEPTQAQTEMARRQVAAGPTRVAAAALPPAKPKPVTFDDLMKPDGNVQPWQDYCQAFA